MPSHPEGPGRCRGVRLPAFQQLVDDHWRDVARLAAALAGAQDGPDVAQQAWTQALANYSSLSHARNLRGWLLTITARVATDFRRAQGRSPTTVSTPPEGGSQDPFPLDEQLWALVRELPERQRIAVALRYGLDQPHAEVARQLGTTTNASRRLVSDALRTLRQGLESETSGEVI